ncbi:mutS protein homolog 5-like isoform X2 [Nylanderia fulva]|uniref:mutS protein homolog 5-like isoform X2 n=1 Tax=Nylanderia fulva TaxID=613905 RepID=UPI0010FB2C60|nr:mutS protein homolog 5-like isoform X2 [Nylanderia fulva]
MSLPSCSRNRSSTPFLANVPVEFESILNETSSDEEEFRSPNIPMTQSSATAQKQSSNVSSAMQFGNFSNRDEIILAMIWSNNQLGAAYFNFLTSELFVMDDTYDDGVNFHITKTLYKQCQPRYVITFSGTSDAFLTTIEALVMSETSSELNRSADTSSVGPTQVSLRVMRKKEHSFDRCYHRVRSLKLESEPANANDVERHVFLQGLLNFKSSVMIHTLGLLLIHIDQHWSNITLNKDPAARPSFVSLTSVTLRDIVMINDDTYEALNIVHTRHHPSLFKCGDAASKKQSESLFILLNRCQSSPGMLFLWKTLQHPTRNIEILNERFEVVEFCLNPNNQSIVENLTLCLKQVYRLTNVTLNRHLAQQAKFSDWVRLHKTISSIIYIADICEEHRKKVKLFHKIVDTITKEVRYIKYFIEYIVDFSAKKSENDFIVRANVDSHLDKLHHVRGTLPKTLTQMAEKDMIEHLPSWVTTCRMVYIPNIGYLLALTQRNPSPADNENFQNLELKFVSKDTRYFKSPGAKELDDSIGDIMLRITKRESYIILKLVKYINKHAASIFNAIQLCAELDTLLAFSVVAREYNYVKPNMVERQIIAVEQGRHPLQEFLTTFVPNDTYSGDGKSLIKVLTGPNASGKSTYLRQIALIVFMAHVGCYVPAKSATIGIMTHILTQITSIESIALNTSMFMQDLRQINSSLNASTSNSLVILDEFGNGTSEVSGLSLLAAVLNNFVQRGIHCPHVFVATHMHRIMNMLPQNPIIKEQTFEFVINDDCSVAHLYRITTGHTTCSFAHAAARMAGLDEDVVKRAEEVYEKFKVGELPPRLPQAAKQDMPVRIIERLLDSEEFNMEELKSLVIQVTDSLFAGSK